MCTADRGSRAAVLLAMALMFGASVSCFAAVTTSVGSVYEQYRDGSTIEHRLIVPGIGVIPYRESNGVLTREPMRFVHSDHLGSTSLVTSDDDASIVRHAVVMEQRSYDAYGLARNPVWLSNSYDGIEPAQVSAGYTMHVDDPELGLVNMDGRIYDPSLARFLTADPLVSSPASTQAWNAYAYVANNPLANTDPSGYAACQVGRIGSGATWICRGTGDGGGTYEYDSQTLAHVQIDTIENGPHPDNGPYGHPASGEEIDELYQPGEAQTTKSGPDSIRDLIRNGTRVASAVAVPGNQDRPLTDADVDSICAPRGDYSPCAQDTTIQARPQPRPLNEYEKMFYGNRLRARPSLGNYWNKEFWMESSKAKNLQNMNNGCPPTRPGGYKTWATDTWRLPWGHSNPTRLSRPLFRKTIPLR
jgi:RHS repeat-associated protein